MTAAIVTGHAGRDLTQDFVALALKNSDFGSIVERGESIGGAILILGAHPQEMTRDDLVLYAPLTKLEERFGSIRLFLEELCHFARDRDDGFLSKFEAKDRISEVFFDIADLKPNVFGVGVNLNRAAERFRE